MELVSYEFDLFLILSSRFFYYDNGPLTRYVQLWVAHAPGMSGMFPLTVS